MVSSIELSSIPFCFKIIKSNSEDIQKENNELLLSKFNKLIYKEIANQPTPNLYEKLGVKMNFKTPLIYSGKI